jgi:hypothetical protein
MQYLTLNEIKKQCVVDQDFHEDDEFLEMIGDSAEDMAEKLMNCTLDELAAENGELPATIRHALRMLVDYFYSVNRGSSENTPDIPNAVNIMLKLYFQFR